MSLTATTSVARAAALCALLVVWEACGSRSALNDCATDADCALRDLCATQRCVARECVLLALTVCDDGNPCTTDKCDKKSGACMFSQTTLDLDGDGHRAPLAGTEPGAPGACGDDCDDTDARAFPGNREVCDGVDNDCDGVVDNGATYEPRAPGADVRVSATDVAYAEPSGLARGGQDTSLALYLGFTSGQLQPYALLLDDLGTARTTPKTVGAAPAAAGSALAVWTGDRYGVAWSDRRGGNYEIYFATFDAGGQKQAPGDMRVTVSDGFSIYPSLVWTGTEFVLAWQEETTAPRGWRIDAQRLGLDGRLLGDIVTLVDLTRDEQAPALAAGRTELGLGWVRLTENVQHVYFSTFGFDLVRRGTPVQVTSTSGGRSAAVVYAKDEYLLAWYVPTPGAREVEAAPFGKDGARLGVSRRIADPGLGQSRDPALLSLGDRVLCVYADDRDGNEGYELYARMLGLDASAAGAARRVTNAPGDSISPFVAFGHAGAVGVLFRDDRGTAPAAYFTSLACAE